MALLSWGADIWASASSDASSVWHVFCLQDIRSGIGSSASVSDGRRIPYSILQQFMTAQCCQCDLRFECRCMIPALCHFALLLATSSSYHTCPNFGEHLNQRNKLHDIIRHEWALSATRLMEARHSWGCLTTRATWLSGKNSSLSGWILVLIHLTVVLIRSIWGVSTRTIQGHLLKPLDLQWKWSARFALTGLIHYFSWSGWKDLNLRPLEPHGAYKLYNYLW